MARLTCRSCKALLPRRGARCRTCGWASSYGSWISHQRERETLLGIGLMLLGLSVAAAVSLAVAYFDWL